MCVSRHIECLTHKLECGARHDFHTQGIPIQSANHDHFPATIDFQNNHRLRLHLPRYRRHHVPTITNATTLPQIINALPQYERQWIGSPVFTKQVSIPIIDCLAQNDIFCASDGSLKDGIAAFSYGITNIERTCSITGGGKCTGAPATLSSLCAETTGALGIISIIGCIDTALPSQCHTQFRAFIDNSTVVKRISNILGKTAALSPLAPAFDLAQQLHTSIQNCTRNGHWKWVRGHQTDESIETQLNNEADTLADEFRQNDSRTPKYHASPTSKIWFESTHSIIHHLTKETFHESIATKELQEFIQKNQGWTLCTHDDVDWHSYTGHSNHSLPPSEYSS